MHEEYSGTLRYSCQVLSITSTYNGFERSDLRLYERRTGIYSTCRSVFAAELFWSLNGIGTRDSSRPSCSREKRNYLQARYLLLQARIPPREAVWASLFRQQEPCFGPNLAAHCHKPVFHLPYIPISPKMYHQKHQQNADSYPHWDDLSTRWNTIPHQTFMVAGEISGSSYTCSIPELDDPRTRSDLG